MQFLMQFKGTHVERLFALERAFLVEASKSAQPSSDVLKKALQPLSKIIEEIQVLYYG